MAGVDKAQEILAALGPDPEWLARDREKQVAAGRMMHAMLNPEHSPGPPYVHTFVQGGWDEVADVTGMSVAEFVRQAGEWPPDAQIWWDDDHVFVVVKA
jgi:hypothetical protein